MSHTLEEFCKSAPCRASLFTCDEKSYRDGGWPGEKAPHPRRTAEHVVPPTQAWRKCLLLLATPKARVPGPGRGLRAGPAFSKPCRGPAGGSALLSQWAPRSGPLPRAGGAAEVVRDVRLLGP